MDFRPVALRPQEGDGQLHSSLAGGNPAQGGTAGEGVVVPAPVDAAPLLPDAVPARLDAAPTAEPYPPLFGLVVTLQTRRSLLNAGLRARRYKVNQTPRRRFVACSNVSTTSAFARN